jgi:CHAT domain-containing protein
MVSVAMNDSTPSQPQHRAAVRGPNGYFFGPLPGTAQEIDGIGKTFRARFGDREIEVLDKTSATEERFRTDAPRHRWLHLATHGFFTPEGVHSALDRQGEEPQRPFGDRSGLRPQVAGPDPALLSGLAFAGANHDPKSSEDSASALGKETDDGIMTALEISELDLRNVDLAVLSACETGLGRVAGGEGVLGLQRAFQTAGARTCVTSFWKVDDTATQLLMKEFYTNLWQKKLGKLESLRQAQLTMLHRYDPGERKLAQRGGLQRPGTSSGFQRGAPYFWAPFVLSGDWR